MASFRSLRISLRLLYFGRKFDMGVHFWVVCWLLLMVEVSEKDLSPSEVMVGSSREEWA